VNDARTIAFEIVSLLAKARLPLSDEKILQNEIEKLIKATGYDYGREIKMVIGTIDFVVGEGVGIEVKIGGQKRKIWRQIGGYLEDPRIEHLIVAASTPLAFPQHSSGKPITVVSLAGAWL
jgi:hypothetical protein